MKTGRVYSYLRFSDPKQATGSSIERQLSYAQRWAAEHNLPLDESLSLRDEGLSAYHQRHVKQGALGAFLRAADEGRVPPGSVLIVEGLDRLSRAEPIQAQAQLAQIVNAGITVVTASDGKEYNRERLKAQPMDLVYSLLVMIRAHEESDTKSKRVKAAIRRQCEAWKAGTWRGIIRNGKDPKWLHWTGEKFEIVQEMADAVKTALSLFRQGIGFQKISERLDEAGLRLSGAGVHSQHIYKIIRNPALIGIKTLEVEGEEFRLEGYYPPLLTEAEFSDLQVMMTNRLRPRGRPAEYPGIITGMGIAKCGYCGGGYAGQNSMRRKKQETGIPWDGHRRIVDSGRGTVRGCPIGGTVSVVPIEKAIMGYCSDQMNLSLLVEGNQREAAIRARLVKHRQKAAELERQLERIMAVVMSAEEDGATPLAFARKARELEAAMAAEKEAELAAERELLSVATKATPAQAEAWAELVHGVATLDHDTRLKARQLVQDTFERIVIYRMGFDPDEWDGKTIGLVLVSKNGNSRTLLVDKSTGAWKVSEDELAEG